jgi:3-dehydroquinate synthase
MAPLQPLVTVNLGVRSYPVYIGNGIIFETGRLARDVGLRGQAAIITDETVDQFYGSALRESISQAGFKASLHRVPAGERSKSFAVLETLTESLARAAVDRQAFVVALGGGVIGDLAGLVAAIYRRGLPYIQVPTTVMAQVDSAVGGKTAINLAAGKNLVGSFHQPRLVVTDTSTPKTLGVREWNEGFAEIIKYGIICDPSLFEQLERSTPPLAELVKRCVEIKAGFVERDEQERSGERALLNFGHTVGHGLEAAAGYGTLLHGEAVSLGMRAAALISMRRAGLQTAEATRIQRLLERYSLPTRLTLNLPPSRILEKILSDKKFIGGKIRFVVIPRLGAAQVTDEVGKEDLEWAIASLAE